MSFICFIYLFVDFLVLCGCCYITLAALPITLIIIGKFKDYVLLEY